MAHSKTDRHISALMPKLTTTRKSKTLCASKFEAHVGDVLEHCGFDAVHEKITFTFDDLPKGQATPDWLIPDPFVENGLMAVEPKGGDTARSQATFDSFAEMCDDEEAQMSAYLLAKFGFLKLHRNGKTAPAALYKCEECGQWHFSHKEAEHYCPYCQGKEITFVTDKLNDYANEIAKPLWEENWKKREAEYNARMAEFDAAKEYEIRLIERIKTIANNIGWKELTTGEAYNGNGLVIQTDYAYESSYIPDFVYEELPNKFTLFGHATPPLVIGSVIDLPSENDEIVLREIKEMLNTTNLNKHAFVKHFIADHHGIRVLDWTTGGEYKRGGIYTCDECGKHYIASDDHICPFCDGTKHHREGNNG